MGSFPVSQARGNRDETCGARAGVVTGTNIYQSDEGSDMPWERVRGGDIISWIPTPESHLKKTTDIHFNLSITEFLLLPRHRQEQTNLLRSICVI